MRILIQTLFFFLLVAQICLAQWVQVGLDDYSINDIAVQNTNIFAVTSDSGKVYRSIDSGTNWTMIVDSMAVAVAISLSGKVFMIKDPVIFGNTPDLFSSLDNGDMWTRVDIMEQLEDSIGWGRLKAITVSPGGIVFCKIWITVGFGYHDKFGKSTDEGLTWTAPGNVVAGGKLFDFKDQLAITFGDANGTDLYGGYLYLSANGGNTWSLLGYGIMNSQVLGFFSNGNIINGGDEYFYPKTIYISMDMCNTWTQIASLNTQVGLSWSSGLLEGMLVGTEDAGIFLFSDEGDSLGSRNEGLTNLNIQALTLDNNGYVYAGTENGVWRRPLSQVTSVEENQIEIPSSYNLSQNFPNPFNPSTKISWQSPVGSWQTLKVFDVLGNEIATLVDEYKPAGNYSAEFNATSLPSGVYFYQMKAGEFISTKKMILLK